MKRLRRGVEYDWDPLEAPYGLLQDKYYPDRWKVAVACILLNCTTAKQVRTVIDNLFELCPSPEAFLSADEYSVKEVIFRLGFKNTRYKRIRSFSEDFTNKKWGLLGECRGIGEYADACDRMYFLGEFDTDPPNDHALVQLWRYVTSGEYRSRAHARP